MIYVSISDTKFYVKSHPTCTLCNEAPAVFDDISLISYVRDKKLCLEMALFYRAKKVYKEFTGLDEFCILEEPSQRLLSMALRHLDIELLRMIYDKYPNIKCHSTYNGIVGPITATLETAEFFYERNLLDVYSIWRLFTHIPVISLVDFLESKGLKYRPDNVIRCMKTEEECREWLRRGNKLELSCLLRRKFVVEDSLIELLYNSTSTEVELSGFLFNPAVMRWLNK